MKRCVSSLVLALGSSFVALTALADTEVTLEELPAPVRQTVEREVKSGTILEIEREDEHGTVVYEVEFIEASIKYEIDVSPDGALLRRHRD